MMQQRYKQQQQAMMQHAMYHPGLVPAPQIEPILSGNLPPGFDSTTCRSVYVGNIHPQVTEPLLYEVFASAGPLEGCKLIRKEKSSYGFVDYYDHRSAALAILTLNGRNLFGQAIKVNWAYASTQREDTSGHFNIFVGDLSPEVTDAVLHSFFSIYPTCSDARVMWDQKTGRSRGFGFVSFRSQQDSQRAVNEMTGQLIGSRQIRCNWATKGAGSSDEQQISDAKVITDLSNGTPDEGQDNANEEAPENNPQFTTVYVGNLAPEVTSLDLHCYFHSLGAGVIEDVRIQRDKGFGFVRYTTHAEAARAIQIGNARILYGKPIKCSWGSKPTPAGTVSNPMAPPAAAAAAMQMPGYFSSDQVAAYERQLALAKISTAQALMHPHAPRMAATQSIYDGGYPGITTTQPGIYHMR